MVDGRVEIATITHSIKLAEPNSIFLQSGAQKMTSAMADWAFFNSSGFVERPFNENGDILPVTYDSSGAAFVSVTPRRLGKVQLMLFISFEDGGVERKTIDLQVVQSERPPEKLVVVLPGRDDRKDTPVISMDLTEANQTTHVFAAAIYKGVTFPVPLHASDVSFKWISSTGGTAKIDPSTGIVTALNIGQALLETSFGGVSTLTCIDVMKNVGGGPRSRCEELLPPGRSLPPTDFSPPPRVRR